MKKLAIYLTLALCLTVLFSGYNVAHAIGWISVSPIFIDLGGLEMGQAFSTTFSVSVSEASLSSPVWVYMSSPLTVSPSSLFFTSPGMAPVTLSGITPSTYGPFSYVTSVNGSYNSAQVTVNGTALYPAPTNVSGTYTTATSQLQYYCDPVPGAVKYEVSVWKKGALPKLLNRTICTSNTGVIPVSISLTLALHITIKALNADESDRSIRSPLTPITVQ